MSANSQQNKFVKFLRNNAALLIILFCAVAILTVVLAVTLTKSPADDPVGNKPTPTPPDEPVIKTEIVKVYYSSPVNYVKKGMEFTDGNDLLFVFNTTLNNWETHKGVDLAADDGTQVCAMYDGTVTTVSESYGLGNLVTIDHGNGVIATYASLGNVEVVKGQVVKKGEKIGEISLSASNEFLDGAHLHLEVTCDGKHVDPMPYVNGDIYNEIEVEVTE
ncbi:MAG: M23 family metallopeptidase [Corallococcus sp.]|nr:M23 family metallopeptidase [Corallococcus sp.]